MDRLPVTPTDSNLNRRELLQCVAAGARGLCPLALGDAVAADAPQDAAPRATMSLIIDDGAPVDPLFYEWPGYETPFLVPCEFTARVADTLERFDLRGKLTIIPMPSCLGRIDRSLRRVPAKHLEGFLKIVRERIAPRLDITPEFLTHLNAYNLKKGGYQHVYEDAWMSQAPLAEVVEYFTLAFQILKNVGLNASGITSPWNSGLDVEKKYAQAVAEAQWNVFQRKVCWYFLHCTTWGEKPRKCSIEYVDRRRGQVVVSVPANAPDIFWTMGKSPDIFAAAEKVLPTRAERMKFIHASIDRLLSADGRTGRIRELIESQSPIMLVTHWQSLWAQGTGIGLEGLAMLAERIQKVFGKRLEWISCYERAQRLVRA